MGNAAESSAQHLRHAFPLNLNPLNSDRFERWDLVGVRIFVLTIPGLEGKMEV